MAAARAERDVIPTIPNFIAATLDELPSGFGGNLILEPPFSVQIPASGDVRLNGIQPDAFRGCSGLTSAVLADGITRIGNSAFQGCGGLISVVLPEGVTEIEEHTFSGCYRLTSLVLPEGVTEIGAQSFFRCSGLTSINMPDGVTNIGAGAFYRCSGITSIVLPEGITEINVYTFNNCSGLTSINITDSVTEIGACAFVACRGLTSVDIPASVIAIRQNAFYKCSWVVVVTLRSSLPIAVHHDAFDSCDHLALVVAPRASGLVGAVVGGVTVVEDTAANRRRALNLQYWRAPTHGLCSPPRRSWVMAVLLVATRLRGGPLTLPREMWYMIVGSIRRCELGPAP